MYMIFRISTTDGGAETAKVMVSSRSRSLLIGATVLSGLLAGGNVDRAIVAMPSWEQVGAPAWAEFSRHADLGNGLVLYPLEAIGAFLLIALTVGSLYVDRAVKANIMLPLYAAVVLAAVGLLCTFKAAPIMLSVAHLNDPTSLRQALDGFRFWGDIRGTAQVLAFFATVWSLTIVFGPDAGKPAAKCPKTEPF
jgi:hypothetical protein